MIEYCLLEDVFLACMQRFGADKISKSLPMRSGGHCCSVGRESDARIRSLQTDENILKDRLRKEVKHELGHTFGLYHCINPLCVMRSSTYVEDIDQKDWKFCAKCRKELGME